MNSKISAWLHAFRLRTLPLSISSIVLASFIAESQQVFKWQVAVLAAFTTLFLQILSNLANDYGDFQKGTDNEHRVGPTRALQGGMLTKPEMKNMIIIFIILSFTSGIWLLYAGLGKILSPSFMAFLLLGIASIAAAIKYTVGSNAYGYRAMGDVYVFLFFGLTGVLGTYFLHSNVLHPHLIFPAISVGFFSTGVLNLNNMRDRVNDLAANKITLAIKFGVKGAKIYHTILIVVGFLAGVVYTLLNFSSWWQFLFLLSLPLFVKNIMAVLRNTEPRELDPQLKKLAIATFLFSLLMGVGNIL